MEELHQSLNDRPQHLRFVKAVSFENSRAQKTDSGHLPKQLYSIFLNKCNLDLKRNYE